MGRKKPCWRTIPFERRIEMNQKQWKEFEKFLKKVDRYLDANGATKEEKMWTARIIEENENRILREPYEDMYKKITKKLNLKGE